MNEWDRQNYDQLCAQIAETQHHSCVDVLVEQDAFKDSFLKHSKEMRNPGCANFIFIDQFGVSEVTEEIFKKIQSMPRTDFMFFVASSIVNRMPNHPCIVDKIPPLTKEEKDEMTGKNVVRVLFKAYKRWVLQPSYYLGQFAIKKEANVYGLIFGSGDLLGIDKFLRTAWTIDPTYGEANYSIDNEDIHLGQQALFEDLNIPRRRQQFAEELRTFVLEGAEKTNRDVYIFTMESGFLAAHAREELKLLIDQGVLKKQHLTLSKDVMRKPAVVIQRCKQ